MMGGHACLWFSCYQMIMISKTSTGSEFLSIVTTPTYREKETYYFVLIFWNSEYLCMVVILFILIFRRRPEPDSGHTQLINIKLD